MIVRKGPRDYKFAAKSSILVRDLIVVDQRPSHEAMLNSAGWPANEITLLMKLNKEQPDSPLIGSLERSLMEIPTPQVDNSGLTDKEIIARTIPKHVGTLSEYLKWVETLPYSASERAYLDEQAKQQFGEGVDGDGDSSSDATVSE